MKLEIVSFAILLFFATNLPQTFSSLEVKGCSVSNNVLKTSNRRWLDISDFEYNFPKNYELLRIVSVFSWELPVVGVYGGKNEWNYYFGNYNSSKNFAIYRNHSDWYSSTNPCDFVMGKEIFSKKPYVPTEIVLGRGEHFDLHRK